MESVLRGLAIYVIMLLAVRISGRRTMAEMTPFDFVLVLIVAETTQQALLGDDFSITNAVILVVTLFMADIGLSQIKQRWAWLDKALDGKPTLLITDGKPDEQALRLARVGMNDIMSAARSKHGLEKLDQIKHAILEADGTLSIVPVS
ncbi:DUF421 domain-containing protein [Rhizorhapis sp. SPR117]|uniref:DUF421 domain-containing protein n=1 Tax=Rhizorhapis sp. SPR117 TaxID=2912611 RepID=UPI001F474AFA|nr:DUF421 domain-containing protein [Rhizorhapis sp. SPR117]